MKSLTILVDMDSIVVNIQEEWYKRYNEDYDDDLSPADIKTWDTHKYVKKECGTKMYGYLKPEMFKKLKPIDGAVAALQKLHWAGHEIVFVTASPEHCADAKVAWVKKHFSVFTRKDIMIGHKKHLVKGDVFIDDAPHNIKSYREAWPDTKILTIAYPYNKEVEELLDLRAGAWDDLKGAWGEFINFIEDLAKDDE